MALDFNGKVVLVTGSSSGIGEYTAYEFAKLGAKVVITGRSTDKLALVEKKCKEVSKDVNKSVFTVVADARKDSDMQRLIDSTISEFGQLDVLVNNAGAG